MMDDVQNFYYYIIHLRYKPLDVRNIGVCNFSLVHINFDNLSSIHTDPYTS
jgi:hypothetical protein